MKNLEKSWLLVSGLLGVVIWIGGCFQEKPTSPDGLAHIAAIVQYENIPLPGARVSLIPHYELLIPPAWTDSLGQAWFHDLPTGIYVVAVEYQLDTLITISGSQEVLAISGDTTWADIRLAPTQKGLKINEIYYAGPVNDEFYFYDQFIELYNASDETVYLDGMIVCRLKRDIDQVIYIFQFPGTPVTGRQYPVAPGQFVVLASDARNHQEIIRSSIDLSQADWEFYNPASPTDPNNPLVPDILNIEEGNRIDFVMNLSVDEIIIATGEDVNYADGIDIETVIDGVEYQSRISSDKTLDPRIDRGFAGVGVACYSGMSIERKLPGLDTNNSTVDFRVLPHPTPGYQAPP